MVGRRCSICEHKSRKEIDKALVLPGSSIRGVARQFRVSDDSLTRHVKGGHIEQKIAKLQAAQDIVEADDLLKEIQEIQGHQKTIFKEARECVRIIKKKDQEDEIIPDPDNKLALEALRDQSKIIELKGKILGSFNKDKAPDDGKRVPGALVPVSPESLKKIGDILAKGG